MNILISARYLNYNIESYNPFLNFLFHIKADTKESKLCAKLFSISCRFGSNEPSMLARGIYRERVVKLLGRNLINGTRFV